MFDRGFHDGGVRLVSAAAAVSVLMASPLSLLSQISMSAPTTPYVATMASVRTRTAPSAAIVTKATPTLRATPADALVGNIKKKIKNVYS